MTTKQIEVNGYKVDVNNFGNATYLYPAFNGNQEFRANHKGFRKLSSYLRTVTYIRERYSQINNSQTTKS
jgi:hypothetical protein